METMIRKFPIGIQSFEKLRKEEYLYVDKTMYISDLVNSGVAYFLSRPRRFGKSLFISTMEAYFTGRKELFDGLAIAEREKAWVEYPVLHLDLNAEKFDHVDRVTLILDRYLHSWEDLYGLDSRERTLSDRFFGIIRRAYEMTGRPVVVLVDEYDKPLLQAIGHPELLDEFKSTLKAFYAVLKSSDRYLKFVFLTGVTKFGQVSVFSDLNQLKDISMDARYESICGISREELEQNFMPDVEALGRAVGLSTEETFGELKRMYDGYHFHPDADGVYNPFSVLNVLDSLEFSDYWFQTGTPTFLVELLQKTDYDLRNVDGVQVTGAVRGGRGTEYPGQGGCRGEDRPIYLRVRVQVGR